MVTATRPTEQSVMTQVYAYDKTSHNVAISHNKTPKSRGRRLVDFVNFIEKTTLEDLSKSIASKLRPNLAGLIAFDELQLSEYDIRVDRDCTKMANDLKRDGQLQPITITVNTINGVVVKLVVNGRTRHGGFACLKNMGVWEANLPNGKVKVEVYENLTQLEQNYLNASINCSQKTSVKNNGFTSPANVILPFFVDKRHGGLIAICPLPCECCLERFYCYSTANKIYKMSFEQWRRKYC